MHEPLLCPDCGTEIAANSPEGLCHKCLLQAGLDESDESHATAFQGPVGATVSYRSVEPLFLSDRYDPVRLHAHGGMGEVWQAKDEQIGRIVALKKLRRPERQDKERFLAEAQITGQLEHPGVVPVHDLGIDKDGQTYYVMKFVDGRTLEDAIDEHHADNRTPHWEKEVDRRRLLEHFLDLCDVIAYAHSRGVIHRDIKPANVMLGSFGETLVVDWGLAKVLHQPEIPGTLSSFVALTSSGRSAETQHGSVLGTPPYMPPELAQGHAAEVGPTCDVYLLGATLYHILTNRKPRQGSSYEEMIDLARTEQPVPPRQRVNGIPRPLDAICVKAMAKRECDRYQSAQEMAEDVRRYLAAEPVSAYPEPWQQRAWRWATRNKRMIGRMATAMVIASALLLALVGFNEARRQRQIEVARGQIADFHTAYDEALFYAGYDAPAERFAYYDASIGAARIETALSIAERWGPDLEDLPLSAEREQLAHELADLLLLKVHLASMQPDSDPQRMLADLERSQLLVSPTREFYRLRSQYYRHQHDDERASQDERLAEDDETPARALDYFLAAERLRKLPAKARIAGIASTGMEPGARRRNLDDAMKAYEAALEVEPNHFWSRLQLGRCLLSAGRVNEAVATLSTCVGMRPQSPWAYSARAPALAFQKRFDAAIEDLDSALAMKPEFLPAKLNRGWVYWQHKDYQQAIDDLEDVLAASQDRGLIEAALYLGQLHFERGDFSSAARYFEQFAEANPSTSIVHRQLATSHVMLGDPQAGLESLDKAFALAAEETFAQESPTIRYQRGQFLRNLATGRLANQVAKERKATQAQRDAISYRREILDLALEELTAAIDSWDDPQESSLADVYYEQAVVLEKLGRNKEAFDAYSQGLKIEPGNLQLLTKMGTTYFNRAFVNYAKGQQEAARENYARAKHSYETATQATPKSPHEEVLVPQAHFWLGYLDALQQDGALQQDPAAAGRAAMRTYLLLEDLPAGEKERYVVLHNLACIYAELSKVDNNQRKELEDLALSFLTRAVRIANTHHEGAMQARAMEVESAFGDKLRRRAEFQQILKEAER